LKTIFGGMRTDVPFRVLNLSQIENNLPQKVYPERNIEDNISHIEDNISLWVLDIPLWVYLLSYIEDNISFWVYLLPHIVFNISLWVYLFPYIVFNISLWVPLFPFWGARYFALGIIFFTDCPAI
jgi:hypothetical protein